MRAERLYEWKEGRDHRGEFFDFVVGRDYTLAETMSFLERVRLIFWTASLDNDKELVKFPLIAFQVRSLTHVLFNRGRAVSMLFYV